ncbi:MAG: hypothetical protein HY974_00735 [Candidatus Kerfeldbacteria bacterium]|nr:hypothetical protein [Candidatus Kerfeldbacteria bacterium]
MKRLIYLVCSTALGTLLGFLVHALLEIGYAQLLFWRFDIWGLGLSWQSWFDIHTVFSLVTFLGGAAWGLGAGWRWWQKIYVRQTSLGFYASWKNKSVLD